MNPQSCERVDSRTDRSPELDNWHPDSGPLVVLHAAIATAAVVGFFAAVSQPFAWLNVVQALLCATIAALLCVGSSNFGAARAERAVEPVLSRRPAALHRK